MLIEPIKTRIFKQGESLRNFILGHIKKVPEKSVIAVTSKIVALAQGRIIRVKSKREKEAWIKKESRQYIKTKWCYLTLKNGHWCANAGIDESNVEGGGIILWPENPYQVARNLRQQLLKDYRIKNFGILITDSRIFPLRAGVSGVALAYAGFKGLRNYIGKKDLFGRRLKMTKTNVADSLASAAVVVMGEGSEACPLALMTGAMVEFKANVDSEELSIKPQDDLYQPLFTHFSFNRNSRRKQ